MSGPGDDGRFERAAAQALIDAGASDVDAVAACFCLGLGWFVDEGVSDAGILKAVRTMLPHVRGKEARERAAFEACMRDPMLREELERTTGLEPATSELGTRRTTDRAASADCGERFVGFLPASEGGDRFTGICDRPAGHPGPHGRKGS